MAGSMRIRECNLVQRVEQDTKVDINSFSIRDVIEFNDQAE